MVSTTTTTESDAAPAVRISSAEKEMVRDVNRDELHILSGIPNEEDEKRPADAEPEVGNEDISAINRLLNAASIGGNVENLSSDTGT